MNQKSSMNVGRESDGREVPATSLNKDGRSSAEGSEGRRPAKENIEQKTTSQTQSWANVLSGLRGVREEARSKKQEARSKKQEAISKKQEAIRGCSPLRYFTMFPFL
jgi:hypothetical protein